MLHSCIDCLRENCIHGFLTSVFKKADDDDVVSFKQWIKNEKFTNLATFQLPLKDDECIILLDFAETYSYVVQDAVQGFQWNNSQATLHPFVAYYKEQNHLNSISFCVLSDYLRHNANVVHVFVYHMLQSLKILLPQVSHVHYFSDGAPSQYKNFKNLTNLIHHQEGHQLIAEWHFFATSHGKSPCDGAGGTVKRLVIHSSFQNNLILNVDLM